MGRSKSLLLCFFEKSPSPPPLFTRPTAAIIFKACEVSSLPKVCPHLLKCFNPAHLSPPPQWANSVSGRLSKLHSVLPSIHPIPPRHNMRPGVERHLRSLIPRSALCLCVRSNASVTVVSAQRRRRRGIRFRMTEQTRFLRLVWSHKQNAAELLGPITVNKRPLRLLDRRGRTCASFSCCIYRENESFTGSSGGRCLPPRFESVCGLLSSEQMENAQVGDCCCCCCLYCYFFIFVARPKLRVHWALRRCLGTASRGSKGRDVDTSVRWLTAGTLFAACVSTQRCI